MKVKGHVVNASDMCDKLRVTGQGQAVTGYKDPSLKPWLSISIDVPNDERNRKTFHVGRRFEIVLTPKS